MSWFLFDDVKYAAPTSKNMVAFETTAKSIHFPPVLNESTGGKCGGG
jgi:hypothetical protein